MSSLSQGAIFGIVTLVLIGVGALIGCVVKLLEMREKRQRSKMYRETVLHPVQRPQPRGIPPPRSSSRTQRSPRSQRSHRPAISRPIPVRPTRPLPHQLPGALFTHPMPTNPPRAVTRGPPLHRPNPATWL